MPMIETDDGTGIFIKEWGDGPAVVLIHGWPLSADSWDDQALALADHGYRVISYDRRGFGRSDQPWDGYDYDTLADDLAAVIEACEVEDPALGGVSMGGGEVARSVSRYSGVRKAALIAFWESAAAFPTRYTATLHKLVICGNEAFVEFSLEVAITGMTPATIALREIFKLDASGKIVSLRAFWDANTVN